MPLIAALNLLITSKAHDMKTIYTDEEGKFRVSLTQHQIIMLVSGYIPYVACSEDPQIPNNNFLWIDHEEQFNDFLLVLHPIPANVLSRVTFHDHLHILTLSPVDLDIELLQLVNEFKLNMQKAGECVRSTVKLPTL